jgi:hypothetical protein
LFVIDLRRALRRVAWVVSLMLLAWVAPAAAADPRVERSPAPAWIEWLAQPAVNPGRIRAAEGGVYDLLYDSQIRTGTGPEQSFRRRMIKVIDRAGLEDAAQTKIDFDPAFEHLLLHRAAIWRDGRMIDRTAAVDIDILRREGELDDGIITGRRTALVRLDNVQVGDVVDIAWTWQAVSSPWPGEYFSQPDMGWSVPVGLTRFRLITPAAKTVAIRQSAGLPKPVVRMAGPMVEREWRVADAAPIPEIGHTPAWWHAWPRLDISTMPSWAAVAAAGARQFQVDQTLPAAYAARVDAIAAASADPARRAIAALRLVQDSIRYTSLSIGLGGFVPRSPAEVIRSGFGDCKDKSQLLATTLRRLGIPAWPALTDSDEGPGLARSLPSEAVFDHVIILARIGGQDRWLDATMSHQGGTLATLAALPYGYALPLRPGQRALAGIPNPTPSANTMMVVETYRYVGGGLKLDVETVFSGDEADIKRSELASSGIAKVERGYLDYYRGAYPGIARAGELRIADNRDANRLVIGESYSLPTSAKDYTKTIANLQATAESVRGLYKELDDADDRTAPIILPWPIKRVHRIVLDMPGYGIQLPRLEDSHGPAFDLVARSWHDGSQAIMEFTLTGKARVLPASAAKDYAKQVVALNDATSWTLDASTPGLAPLGAGWLGLAIAVLLIFSFMALAMLRRRSRRMALIVRNDTNSQLVIRHVPITRRNAA